MIRIEDYNMGYKDALAYVRKEIKRRIDEKEKLLEQFSDEDYVSSVAATQHNIKVGLGVAKMVIDDICKRCHVDDLL